MSVTDKEAFDLLNVLQGNSKSILSKQSTRQD